LFVPNFLIIVETVEMRGVEKKQMFKLRVCADNWPYIVQISRRLLHETMRNRHCDIGK